MCCANGAGRNLPTVIGDAVHRFSNAVDLNLPSVGGQPLVASQATSGTIRTADARAFSTNRLALNAAFEVTHVSDAGRGVCDRHWVALPGTRPSIDRILYTEPPVYRV